MATIQNKCLGFTLPVSVPDTVEDFDKLAGKPGAALGEAIKNILYRSWNNEFRAAFVEGVEKETGEKRRVDEEKTKASKAKKDGTQTEVLEQEGAYFARILASGFKLDQFNDLAQKVASEVAFDPSEGARGTGRVGKEYLTAADTLLSEDADTLARKVAKLQTLNPGLTVDLDDEKDPTRPSRETLAKAIKVNADRKAREALAELND